MPATIYRTPDDIAPPNLSVADIKTYMAECDAYRERAAEWARANTNSATLTSANDDLVGEIISFPKGDGSADYVVYKTKPLALLHLEDGDAWHADEITLRGLRVADIKRMVDGQRKLRELFSNQGDWFDGLEVGTTLHYCNGHKTFVRCEVVIGNGDNLRDHRGDVREEYLGKPVLFPIALIGEWREHDLPRVDRFTGNVQRGYHAAAIYEQRGAFRPSDGCVYESPKVSSNYSNGADPRTLEPCDLTPRPLTVDQLRDLPAWKQVQAVKDAVSNRDTWNDPHTMLADVRAVLAE